MESQAIWNISYNPEILPLLVAFLPILFLTFAWKIIILRIINKNSSSLWTFFSKMRIRLISLTFRLICPVNFSEFILALSYAFPKLSIHFTYSRKSSLFSFCFLRKKAIYNIELIFRREINWANAEFIFQGFS
jgi:hypothetical protein